MTKPITSMRLDPVLMEKVRGIAEAEGVTLTELMERGLRIVVDKYRRGKWPTRTQ